MPEIKETSILIDHETGKVLIDTNVRGVASTLLRRGFVEFGGKNSIPYRRFEGVERQVSFRGAVKKKGARATMVKVRGAKRARTGKEVPR